MRKIYIYASFLIIAIFTTIAYRFVEVKWIDFRRAENYFSQGRYSKAIGYYLKSLKKELESKYLVDQITVAAINTKIYQPIVLDFEQSVKKKPKDRYLVEGYSNFLKNFQKFDEAIGIILAYLQYHPKDYYLRLQLARAYFWNKEYQKSIEEYEEVSKHKVRKPLILKYRVRLEYAQMLVFMKKYEEAELEYKKLIRKKSRNWQIQIDLANLYLLQKNYDKAFEVLKNIPVRKLDDQSQLFLADLYALKNEYTSAANLYEKYIKKHPQNEKVILHYSEMRFWSKDSEEIKNVLENIKSFYSSDDDDLVDLADTYLFARKFNQAIKIYEYLINRSKEEEPKILEDLGDIYLSIADKDEAARYYEKAYKFDPDDQKMAKKYALCLTWMNNYEKAFPILKELYEKDKINLDIGIALVRAYMKFEEKNLAKALLDKFLVKFPDSIRVQMEYANFYANLGYFKIAKSMYERLLDVSKFKENVLLGFANIMNLWGDFYKNENIYSEYLSVHPNDFDIKFRLAWTLVSQERYEEANQMYLQILNWKIDEDRCYLQLARLKLLQREIDKALNYANNAYILNPNEENTLVLIQALINNKQIDEALNYLGELKEKEYKKIAYLEIGRALIKKDRDKAIKIFQEGYLSYPGDIKLYFYENIAKILEKDFIDELTKRAEDAKDLTEIAYLYAAEKESDISLKFFEKAISKDNKYYPAKIGYAQVLGSNNLPAVDKFNELLKVFPDDYLFLLWKARVLGWSKHYKSSIKAYSILENLKPENPVVIREKARVASWDQNNKLAMQIYRKALKPSVDSVLYDSIVKAIDQTQDTLFQKDLNYLEKCNYYCGYEKIEQNLNNYELSEKNKNILKNILLDNIAQFQIQKSIALEKKAKNLLYYMQYMEANKVYEELVDFSPSNQEALYDYAQTYCYLNLCEESKRVYKTLADNYYHSLSEMAYERSVILSQPYLKAKHLYYQEKGRGDLDRVIRNKTDLGVGFFTNCRYSFIIIPHRWEEKPTYRRDSAIKDVGQLIGKTYDAYGFSLGFEGTFNEFVSANAGLTEKFYTNSFDNCTLANINLLFNIYDYVKLNVGFDRDTKIDNIFSFRNDVLVNTLFLQADSVIHRLFSVKALSKSKIFSDSNFMQQLDLDLGLYLKQFPTICRFVVKGEFRNTNKSNVYVFDGTDLTNIIHPYWTPKRYFGWWCRVIWHHDVSKYQYCKNEKRYYEMELETGSDTEKNSSIRFQGGWFWEFNKRYLFNIKGYVHRSKLWNSDVVEVEFKCNF